MNDLKRRFFAGDTLQQALIQAANQFNLPPEEIAYRSIEKRHGFLKTRRRVLIEVDPDAPRRDPWAASPPAPEPVAEASEAAAAPAPVLAPIPAAIPAGRPEPAARPERSARDRNDRAHREEPGDNRGNRAPQAERGDRGRGRGPLPGPRGPGDRPARRDDRANRGPARQDRGQDRGQARGGQREDRPRGERASRFEGHVRPPQPSAERLTRVEADSFDLPPANGLIALPEIPRRPSERFPEAAGPQAEAAAKGMELLLRIAGLSLTPRILQGDERLEVDLSGDDVDWCFADDGEFVVSVEHLLPRVIRSLSGEAPLVRVDCDNFQEIREERLRSLAQRVAEEVRRKARPRTLEPMNPADRRIIHLTLADDPGVVSESSGDGYFKRVTIRPA